MCGPMMPMPPSFDCVGLLFVDDSAGPFGTRPFLVQEKIQPCRLPTK
jgi:hypothetical protein